MLTSEKWKELSRPLYVEEIELREKAQDVGLTVEEKARLDYLGKLVNRFFSRFLKHYYKIM